MPLSKKSCQLLARVNFPPYTLQCLTERHVLLAGGGGSSKTGIKNVIEVYELICDGRGGCKAKSVAHYETGDQAIMNCAVYRAGCLFFLFAGMEGLCQVYKLKFKNMDEENISSENSKDVKSGEVNNTNLRARGTKSKLHDPSSLNGFLQSSKDSAENSFPDDLVIEIQSIKSFQTDFSDDPFQKLARFSKVKQVLATAGTDGHIRVWKFPGMKKLYELHAHEDDVDDLDFSPTGDQMVSVSRDGHGKVWNSKDGSLICELQYDLPGKSESKYTFKSCRYGVVEGDETNVALFVSLNPRVRRKPPLPSYLGKWNGKTFAMEKIVSAGYEMLSAISVSDDGHFVGLGTQEGSVKIFIAFSLQMLYQADHIHSIFITGLEFLPSSPASKRITGGYEASLISISVDNHINIHRIPYRATMSALTIGFVFVVVLFFMFLVMDYFNL